MMRWLFALLVAALLGGTAAFLWRAGEPGVVVAPLSKLKVVAPSSDPASAELERLRAEALARQRHALEEEATRRGIDILGKVDSRSDREAIADLMRRLEEAPPRPRQVESHPAITLPSSASTPDAASLLSIAAFEWPPPKASSRIVLPRGLLLGRANAPPKLRDIARRLREALLVAGYDEQSFYRLRSDGFALVTRVERLSDDGAPLRSARWSPPDAAEPFSLVRFMLGLVRPEPGHYRLIVFAVTPESFDNTGRQIRAGEASGLLDKGATALPRRLAEQPFTEDHNCVALIYEFLKDNPDATPRLLEPSRFSALDHLQKSAIWAALQP